jgi:glycine/D-amino acid oxidase-like deaminating enzyme
VEKGLKVLTADFYNEKSSSRIAAGLMNPVTGRNFQQTWLAKEIFPFAKKFYQNLEKKLSVKFYREKNICRILSSVGEQNDWSIRDQTFGNFDTREREGIAMPFGCININSGGYVDIPALLKASETYFRSRGARLDGRILPQEIKREGKKWGYQNFSFEKVVWACGADDAQNELWSDLPFKPTRGEILYVRVAENLEDEIYSAGVWLLPFHGGFHKIGSTYDRDNLHTQPTEEGKKFLTDKVKKFLKSDFSVLEHLCGIRPTTSDRRPFIGEHQSEKNHFIFNGFGAKGVSLTPYFADELTEFFLTEKKINPEVSNERFRYEKN